MSILFLLLFQNGDCGILMLCLSGLGLVLNCLDTNNLPFNSPRCLDMFGKLDKSLLISSGTSPVSSATLKNSFYMSQLSLNVPR